MKKLLFIFVLLFAIGCEKDKVFELDNSNLDTFGSHESWEYVIPGTLPGNSKFALRCNFYMEQSYVDVVRAFRTQVTSVPIYETRPLFTGMSAAMGYNEANPWNPAPPFFSDYYGWQAAEQLDIKIIWKHMKDRDMRTQCGEFSILSNSLRLKTGIFSEEDVFTITVAGGIQPATHTMSLVAYDHYDKNLPVAAPDGRIYRIECGMFTFKIVDIRSDEEADFFVMLEEARANILSGNTHDAFEFYTIVQEENLTRAAHPHPNPVYAVSNYMPTHVECVEPINNDGLYTHHYWRRLEHFVDSEQGAFRNWAGSHGFPHVDFQKLDHFLFLFLCEPTFTGRSQQHVDDVTAWTQGYIAGLSCSN